VAEDRWTGSLSGARRGRYECRSGTETIGSEGPRPRREELGPGGLGDLSGAKRGQQEPHWNTFDDHAAKIARKGCRVCMTVPTAEDSGRMRHEGRGAGWVTEMPRPLAAGRLRSCQGRRVRRNG
jgi:hypothetical protein